MVEYTCSSQLYYLEFDLNGKLNLADSEGGERGIDKATMRGIGIFLLALLKAKRVKKLKALYTPLVIILS